MIKKIAIAFSCLFFLSCGNPEPTNLDVVISTSRTNLLKTTTTSCYANILAQSPKPTNDIAARYFELKAPQLVWKSAKSDARIYNIRFDLTGGPMGNLTLDIGGDELRALFNNTNPALDNVIGPAPVDGSGNPVPITLALMCSLKVGGITVSDAQDVAFDMSGTVTIEGIEREIPGGEETEFSSISTFTVHNRGRTQ